MVTLAEEETMIRFATILAVLCCATARAADKRNAYVAFDDSMLAKEQAEAAERFREKGITKRNRLGEWTTLSKLFPMPAHPQHPVPRYRLSTTDLLRILGKPQQVSSVEG